MGLFKRAAESAKALIAPQVPESIGDDPDAIELTLEQRVARLEVENGDLWEHLRRWSARQAARARRDLEAEERGNGALQGDASGQIPPPLGKLVPGSKAWRDHQKSLIRGGAS